MFRVLCSSATRFLVFGVLLSQQQRAAAQGAIVGTVRSSEGEPLFRVPVVANRAGEGAQGPLAGNPPVPGRTLTDASGAYRIEGLPPGRYNVSSGLGIPSGATDSGVLEVVTGATLTVDFMTPPPSAPPRVVRGRMVLNAASAARPLPNRLTFINATVATHADGTFTGLLHPGMRRVTVSAPNGYFVDTVTLGSILLYSARELGRTPNPMAFSIAVPAEPAPTPEFLITLGTR